MNLQHERIIAACDALSLTAIAEQYDTLAQEAASKESSYIEFLESCLSAEQEVRRVRSRAIHSRRIDRVARTSSKSRRRRSEKARISAGVPGSIPSGAQSACHAPTRSSRSLSS